MRSLVISFSGPALALTRTSKINIKIDRDLVGG